MNRPLKIIAALSLLLNLLLAGIILGHAGRSVMHSNELRPTREELASLPEDKRKLLEDSLQKAEEDTGELRERLSDARKQAALLLKTENFDRDAYLAQVRHIHELRGQIMRHMAEAIAGVAAQFTPQERGVLVEMVRRVQTSAKPPHS